MLKLAAATPQLPLLPSVVAPVTAAMAKLLVTITPSATIITIAAPVAKQLQFLSV